MQILSSVTGQELTGKSLLQSCPQDLLQYFSGETFTQGKHQCFFLNQADLPGVKSTSLRSQGRLLSLWEHSSHFVASGVTPAHTPSSAFPGLGLGHYTQNRRKRENCTDSLIATETAKHQAQALGISHTLLAHILHPRHWGVCVGRGRNRLCSCPSSWTTAAPCYS